MNHILDEAMAEIFKSFAQHVEEMISLNATFMARRGEAALKQSHEELMQLDEAVRSRNVSVSSEFIFALVTIKALIPELLNVLEPHEKEAL